VHSTNLQQGGFHSSGTINQGSVRKEGMGRKKKSNVSVVQTMAGGSKLKKEKKIIGEVLKGSRRKRPEQRRS